MPTPNNAFVVLDRCERRFFNETPNWVLVMWEKPDGDIAWDLTDHTTLSGSLGAVRAADEILRRRLTAQEAPKQ